MCSRWATLQFQPILHDQKDLELFRWTRRKSGLQRFRQEFVVKNRHKAKGNRRQHAQNLPKFHGWSKVSQEALSMKLMQGTSKYFDLRSKIPQFCLHHVLPTSFRYPVWHLPRYHCQYLKKTLSRESQVCFLPGYTLLSTF